MTPDSKRSQQTLEALTSISFSASSPYRVTTLDPLSAANFFMASEAAAVLKAAVMASFASGGMSFGVGKPLGDGRDGAVALHVEGLAVHDRQGLELLGPEHFGHFHGELHDGLHLSLDGGRHRGGSALVGNVPVPAEETVTGRAFMASMRSFRSLKGELAGTQMTLGVKTAMKEA